MRSLTILLTPVALLLLALPAPAQDDAVPVAVLPAGHDGHAGQTDATGQNGEAVDVALEEQEADEHAGHGSAADGEASGEDDHAAHGGGHTGHGSEHADILGLTHSRHASGTSWMPDSTPVYAWMEQRGAWTHMYHGAAHLSYIEMSGPRGDSGLYSQNWGMVKASRKAGCSAAWELTGMFSLDPLTVGGAGYPLLFQTGETWDDEPLHDHQHPHNYFIDLSAKYKWLVNPDTAMFAYLAPVGEPALGPPAFMHRTLALDFPLSPQGHHWQDATHIAYGVATLGVQSREWQLEGSLFNGREPGEDRAAIDAPTFDSYSGRLSWNPGRNLSLQVSRGELKDPEEHHPGNVSRTTASAIYNHDLGCNRNWQTAFVWGRNELEGGGRSDSWLVESALKQDGGWSPFFRYEQVEKSAEELVLPDSFEHDEVFTVRQGSVGFSYDLNEDGPLLWGLGGAYTFNLSPGALDSIYGSNPDGWMLFLRVHPSRMSHGGGEDHGGHGGNAAHVEHDVDGAADADAATAHSGHGADSAAEEDSAELHSGEIAEHGGHEQHITDAESDAGEAPAPPAEDHSGHSH